MSIGKQIKSRREQLVNFFKFVTGVFRKDTHHRSNTVLLVVILEEIKNLLVIRSDFADTFGIFHVIHPLWAPVIETKQAGLTNMAKIHIQANVAKIKDAQAATLSRIWKDHKKDIETLETGAKPTDEILKTIEKVATATAKGFEG